LTAGGSAATPLLSLTQLVPVGAVSTLVGQVTIPVGVSAVVIELRDDVDANATVDFDKIGLFARD
jgi:hypothetical protein